MNGKAFVRLSEYYRTVSEGAKSQKLPKKYYYWGIKLFSLLCSTFLLFFLPFIATRVDFQKHSTTPSVTNPFVLAFAALLFHVDILFIFIFPFLSNPHWNEIQNVHKQHASSKSVKVGAERNGEEEKSLSENNKNLIRYFDSLKLSAIFSRVTFSTTTAGCCLKTIKPICNSFTISSE